MAAERQQPSRFAKQKLGIIVEYEPKVEGKLSEIESNEKSARVKKYGDDFAKAIEIWTLVGSKNIRNFFFTGKIWDDNTLLPVDILRYLQAFWKVMNGSSIPRFAMNTIMYRGIDFTPVWFQDTNYISENVISNWSLSPGIAEQFTDQQSDCCLLQAVFPIGTKHYFTGYSGGELEYIIPGGIFRLIKPATFTGVTTRLTGKLKTIKLYILEYIPGSQHFPWPSESKSLETRTNYATLLQKLELKKKVPNK